MMQTLYPAIDWHKRWYDTLTIPPLGTQDTDQVKDWLNHSITVPIANYQHYPIHFVNQEDLPANTAYETYIAQTGYVPTRDNFHDLLGGIIWLNFPKTKAVFNQLHQYDIENTGVQPKRSLLRNILTLFDENGGIVVSAQLSVLQALQQFDWQTALWTERAAWSHQTQAQTQAAFFPFGHALLEKLIAPRLAICAHTLLLWVDADFFALTVAQQRQQLDTALSEFFLSHIHRLTSKSFQPLPVLGIPTFFDGQDAAFYTNKQVFRDKSPFRTTQIWRFRRGEKILPAE